MHKTVAFFVFRVAKQLQKHRHPFGVRKLVLKKLSNNYKKNDFFFKF